MAEFRLPDYGSHRSHSVPDVSPSANIEEPVFTLGDIGQTVPEVDPSGRLKNIVQTVQAALRSGAGQLQLVLMVPPESAIGGRPKAYGKEVRTALKDLLYANKANLVGIELPTALNNLSGMNMQRGTLDEDTRKRHLDEVKDAIQFAAEVAGGGGIDIVSWEAPRTLISPKWNQQGKWKGVFKMPGQDEIIVVDDRTGAIHKLPKEGIPAPIENKKGEIPMWKWEDFVKYAEEKSKKLGKPVDPLDEYKDAIFGRQIKVAEHEIAYRKFEIDRRKRELESEEEEIKEKAGVKELPKDDKKRIEFAKKHLDKRKGDSYEIAFNLVKTEIDYIKEQERIRKEHIERIGSLKKIEDVGMERAKQSYAEAGLFAMDETHRLKTKPIHVGPENGWPDYVGSHPQEYKELILGARKKMVEKLKDRGFSEDRAEKEAETHIKGLFDTGHLGMWFQNFMPDKPYDERLKKFKQWYMDQVDDLAKSGIVGSMQVVDSASGAHGHLPPGQGIFPVVEAAKEFKKQGFDGFIVSEGHEEERFNEGRILVKAWHAFNAKLGKEYQQGVPQTWSQVENNYTWKTYAPRQMFGSYTPPFGEYKPWSEIPFE